MPAMPSRAASWLVLVAACDGVRCNGAAVATDRDAATGLVAVPCDGTREVTP